MKLENGTEVIDNNGKNIGTIGEIIRDSWTGEIRKFTVKTENIFDELIYSPEDVEEATENQVKLKTAFNKPADVSIQTGAKVIDKNGKELGIVDYVINDSYTGKVNGFRTATEDGQNLFFSINDIFSVTVTEVKLKGAADTTPPAG
jgi:sporulation protein YlmC with PRC-barrel domain